MTIACPALLVCAPASGHGKTSITAALARHHRRQGRRVRCFKAGPDFIDPMVLVQASGEPVYNLDRWIMGDAHCEQLLYEAAASCDLILVEGAMGLFDGDPSSADLADRFELPLLPVIDASAMAQTFGAVLHGLATWRPGLRLGGAVANRVASLRHAELLRQAVSADVPLATIARTPQAALPERHLGLRLAQEIEDLDERLDALAELIAQSPLAELPAPVTFEPPATTITVPPLLADVRVAVACDQAFSFLYQANLEWLQRMGARLQLFSPLNDRELPEADAIYLPGGYPELYGQALARNWRLREAIAAHAAAGLPLLAECGGMMYLADKLVDLEGKSYPMCGVLPGSATMGNRLAALGSQEVVVEGRPLRGHTFHYSSFACALAPAWQAQTADGRPGEAVYRRGATIASYLHWYFPSDPARVAGWLRGQSEQGVH